MRSSRNSIQIIGFLNAKGVEIKSFSNGGRIATFQVATTEKYTTKDNVKKEHTDWHTVVVKIPGLIDVVEKYLKPKGFVLVSGSMHYEVVEKDNVTKVYPKISASEIVLLDRPAKADNGSAPVSQAAATSGNPNSVSMNIEVPAAAGSDDLPF